MNEFRNYFILLEMARSGVDPVSILLEYKNHMFICQSVISYFDFILLYLISTAYAQTLLKIRQLSRNLSRALRFTAAVCFKDRMLSYCVSFLLQEHVKMFNI